MEINWSFGLRASSGKYLTAESFGYRINCNGGSLKKKQIFHLEMDGSDCYIRTHLNRYLTAKEDGTFGADAESKGNDEKWTIEPQSDGRWALKSAHGFYCGGQSEDLSAFTKVISEDRLWVIHLAMHPQVNVRNVVRKRYVHLSDNALTCDEDIPWGDDAMITLVFFDSTAKYGLQACNGSFLSTSGELKEKADESCQYVIVFDGGMVSLKGNNNKYLSALGGKGTLKATKDSISKDEQFVLEDSQPQVKLTSVNGKKVSVSQGVELSASQADAGDTEFFQLEIDTSSKAERPPFALKCKKGREVSYWCMQDDGSIHAKPAMGQLDANNYFNIEWLGTNIALKANNGKFVSTKKNGQLAATDDAPGERSKYVWEIINRPRLVLRGNHGFVGTLGSGLLECNKSVFEVYTMHVSKGQCFISNSSTGKYWKVGPNGITCTGEEPEPFTLEMIANSKMLIKAGDKYLQGQQNGQFTATGTKADASTLWEY